jgi:hypothetical protein
MRLLLHEIIDVHLSYSNLHLCNINVEACRCDLMQTHVSHVVCRRPVRLIEWRCCGLCLYIQPPTLEGLLNCCLLAKVLLLQGGILCGWQCPENQYVSINLLEVHGVAAHHIGTIVGAHHCCKVDVELDLGILDREHL